MGRPVSISSAWLGDRLIHPVPPGTLVECLICEGEFKARECYRFASTVDFGKAVWTCETCWRRAKVRGEFVSSLGLSNGVLLPRRHDGEPKAGVGNNITDSIGTFV